MTQQRQSRPTIKKRPAWVYTPPARPGLADLRAGGERRRRFTAYWLWDNIDNAADIAMFFALKLLPARLCSAIGAVLGRHSIPRSHKAAVARARANLRTLHPAGTEAEIEALMVRFAESKGRQLAEYSALTRIARNLDRIRFVGTKGLVERCRDQPVIFLGAHIGNWEVLVHCLIDMGLPVTINYDPPKRRARHWIVNRVRKAGGATIVPPGKDYVRPALRFLADGGNLTLFCDEGFNGRMRAPFFGRPPHTNGNYALLARLARRTNALIYPVYLTRDQGVNFTFHALEPFRLPPEETPGSRLIDDVVLLNDIIEPIVRAHAEQWHFIDARMPD